MTQLGAWGARSPVPPDSQEIGPDSIVLALRSLFDAERGRRSDASYELRLGEDRFHVEIARRRARARPRPGSRAIGRGDRDRPRHPGGATYRPAPARRRSGVPARSASRAQRRRSVASSASSQCPSHTRGPPGPPLIPIDRERCLSPRDDQGNNGRIASKGRRGQGEDGEEVLRIRCNPSSRSLTRCSSVSTLSNRPIDPGLGNHPAARRSSSLAC